MCQRYSAVRAMNTANAPAPASQRRCQRLPVCDSAHVLVCNDVTCAMFCRSVITIMGLCHARCWLRCALRMSGIGRADAAARRRCAGHIFKHARLVIASAERNPIRADWLVGCACSASRDAIAGRKPCWAAICGLIETECEKLK